ncbi:alpha/beta hydrolase [Streptomyces capparidis]
MLAVAGTLLAGTLAAAPAATARGTAGGDGAGQGVAEAAGVRIAAARAARAGIDWSACPADWGLPAAVECGWVRVPVDYAKPYGRQIRIAVDRATATGTPAQRQGALVYNPGGPGGSGLRFPVRVTGKNPIWAKTAEAYDFVGFDPRGVGKSAPISCQDPQEFVKAPKMDPVPDDEADKLAQRKLAREYAEGCAERNPWMLPHMTTPNTARDLDVIRAALGERRLNFIGASYGTYLGAVYATLFPRHVRRMVMDSVVNPSREKIWYQANLDQDVAFDMRWSDFKEWVARHDATYRIGSTPQEVERAWQQLRAEARRAPIGGVVGPAELLGFFQAAPYYDSYWTVVAGAWSSHRAGDPRPLLDAAAPDPSDTAGNAAAENGNAVYTAVECTDAKWPTDWRVWDRDNTALHAKHPFLTWSNAWLNLPCATWGVPQRTPVEVRGGRHLPPVLIVQATRDAATPYEGALELHRRLKGSRLITERDAGSHGVTNLANPCVNTRVEAYLLRGALDPSDVTCAPHATPVPQPTTRARTAAGAADLPTVR